MANATIPASANTSTETVVTSFITNGCLCAAFVIAFLLLRIPFKRIYQPKSAYDFVPAEKKPEPLPMGPYQWLVALLLKPHSFILQQAGIDGYFFIRYLYVCGWIFLYGSLLLLPLLLPINAVGGNGIVGFDRFTISNIAHKSRYYAHAIISWVFYGGVLFTLYRELYYFASLRQAALSSPRYAKKLSSRTVLFQSVTDQFLDEAEFFKLFHGVERIWVARAQPDLSSKVRERMDIATKLEGAVTKHLKRAYKAKLRADKKRVSMEEVHRPTKRRFFVGRKTDVIDSLKKKLPPLNDEIARMQATFEDARPLNSVFVEFESQYMAQMAYQTVLSHTTLTMSPKQIGIEPSDIIWSNMRLLWWERLIRQFGAAAAACALIVLWVIPVAFVGSISNIPYLVKTLPWLGFIDNLPTVLLGLITSLLPTFMLSLLMSFLPVFIRAFAKLSGAASIQEVEYYAQLVYFAFQLVHVFLITTVASSATAVVGAIINHPEEAMTLLAEGLPRSSNFFVAYLLLQGFSGAGGTLLQISTLVMFYILGVTFDSTARQKWARWSSLSSFSWGTTFPIHTNLVVITLSYSVISPLIVPFAMFCFLFLYIAYLHNISYINVEGSDGRGMYYPRAIFQTFTGLYLGQLCLLGIFVVGKGWGPIIMEAISLCATAFVHYNLKASFGPLMGVVPVDCMKPSDGVSETPSYPGQAASDVNLRYQNARDIKAHANRSHDGAWMSQPLLAEDIDYYVAPPPRNPFFRFFLPARYLNFSEVKKLLPLVFRSPLESDMYGNKHAYDFPDVSAKPPVLWLPKDPMGLSDQEIHQLVGIIEASNEGALFDDHAKVVFHGDPPSEGQPEAKEMKEEDDDPFA